MEKSDAKETAARRHPLDPLSVKEVSEAIRILRTHGPASDHWRFVSVNLHEPIKSELESIGVGNAPGPARLHYRARSRCPIACWKRSSACAMRPCSHVKNAAASSPVSSSKSSSCARMPSKPTRDGVRRSRAEASLNSIKRSSIPGRRVLMAMNVFQTAASPKASHGFAAAMQTSAMAVRLRD